MSIATENQARAVQFEQEPDLTFLATGEYQHVFVRTGAEDDPWVYKIPAAFGFTLTFDQPARFFWPRTVYEKTLYFTLLTLPGGLERRLSGGFGTAVRRAGQRLAAVHCRRIRRLDFERMLGIVEFISAGGLEDILLPCRVARLATARLQVEDQHHAYRGPLLVQRKAALFEAGVDLAAFTWQDVIDAQHRLWRHGIGIFGCLEILGTRSWSLLDGRVRLADTSALTRDGRLIRGGLERAIDRETFDQALRMLQAVGCGESAEDYLRHVLSHMNPDRFDQLWCTDSN